MSMQNNRGEYEGCSSNYDPENQWPSQENMYQYSKRYWTSPEQTDYRASSSKTMTAQKSASHAPNIAELLHAVMGRSKSDVSESVDQMALVRTLLSHLGDADIPDEAQALIRKILEKQAAPDDDDDDCDRRPPTAQGKIVTTEDDDDVDRYLYSSEKPPPCVGNSDEEADVESHEDGSVQEVIAEFYRHVQAQGGRIDPELKANIMEFLTQKFAEGSIRSEVIEKFTRILEEAEESQREDSGYTASPPPLQHSPPTSRWSDKPSGSVSEKVKVPNTKHPTLSPKEVLKLHADQHEITKKMEILEKELDRLESQRSVFVGKKQSTTKSILAATEKVADDIRRQVAQCKMDLAKICVKLEPKVTSEMASRKEEAASLPEVGGRESRKRASAADFWMQPLANQPREKTPPPKEPRSKLAGLAKDILAGNNTSDSLLRNLQDTLRNLSGSGMVDVLLKNILGEGKEKIAKEEEEEDREGARKKKHKLPAEVLSPEEIEYIDSGAHWCKHCDLLFPQLQSFLIHLSKNHPPDQLFSEKPVPWRPVNPGKLKSLPKKAQRPVKGVEFIFPSMAFYCTCCKEFSGDAEAAKVHLTSAEHHVKYHEFTERHPNYEEALEERKKQAVAASANMEAIRDSTKETLPLAPTITVKPLSAPGPVKGVPSQPVEMVKVQSKLQEAKHEEKSSKHEEKSSKRARYDSDRHEKRGEERAPSRERDCYKQSSYSHSRKHSRDSVEQQERKQDGKRSSRSTDRSSSYYERKSRESAGGRPRMSWDEPSDEIAKDERANKQKSPIPDAIATMERAKQTVQSMLQEKSKANKATVDRYSRMSRILDDDSPPLTHPSNRREREKKKRSSSPLLKPAAPKKDADPEKTARQLKMQQLMVKFHQKRTETTKKVGDDNRPARKLSAQTPSFFASKYSGNEQVPVGNGEAPPVGQQAQPVVAQQPQAVATQWAAGQSYWPNEMADPNAYWSTAGYQQQWADYYQSAGYSAPNSWYENQPTPAPVPADVPVPKPAPKAPQKDIDDDFDSHCADMDGLSDAPPGVDPS